VVNQEWPTFVPRSTVRDLCLSFRIRRDIKFVLVVYMTLYNENKELVTFVPRSTVRDLCLSFSTRRDMYSRGIFGINFPKRFFTLGIKQSNKQTMKQGNKGIEWGFWQKKIQRKQQNFWNENENEKINTKKTVMYQISCLSSNRDVLVFSPVPLYPLKTNKISLFIPHELF